MRWAAPYYPGTACLRAGRAELALDQDADAAALPERITRARTRARIRPRSGFSLLERFGAEPEQIEAAVATRRSRRRTHPARLDPATAGTTLSVKFVRSYRDGGILRASPVGFYVYHLPL